jgi:hypothetical protein
MICGQETRAKEELMRKTIWILSIVMILGLGLSIFAQEGTQPAAPGKTPYATSLLFREDFKAVTGGQVQFTKDALTNPNLELKVYGPGSKPGNANQSGLLLGNEQDPTNPGKMMSIVFTGVVEANWAIMVKDKNNYLDLRDTGRLRWRVRQRSLHQIRPLIKLSDGTLLVGDYQEPLSTYMRETELYLIDVPRWRPLNPATMYEASTKPGEPLWKTNVDLSKVDEIGFTDLMAGAGHGTQGNIAVDWIEVHGNPVKRTVSQSQAR